MLYFYLLDTETFHHRLHPALTASWQERSFAPCRLLCAEWLPAARDFQQRYHLGPEDLLLGRVADTLAFDRQRWRLLVGELLLLAAREIPQLETAPQTLLALLAPEQFARLGAERRHWPAIHQVHFGARDLVFGSAYYRPDHAGWNDGAAVRRLADYLKAVDTQQWRAADLALLEDLTTEEDRAEELAYAQEWFPALVDLYQRAGAGNCLVVCEVLGER